MLFATTGCSFTWGQGLVYHRWIEQCKTEKKSWRNFKDEYQWIDVMGKITNQDYIFQNSLRCAGLLAKTLKCDYLINEENGGSNMRSFKRIERWVSTHKVNPNRKLDFIILQLTEPYRDHLNQAGDDHWMIEIPNYPGVPDFDTPYSHDIFMNKFYSKDMFLQMVENCRSNGIDLLIWSWQDELARLLKDEDFFIKLKYGGKEYISFNDIKRDWPVGLDQDLKLLDEHPNKFFNQLLHDNIIEKLKDRNII